MAEKLKDEYHVIGEDGNAFAWEDDILVALSHCKDGKAIRIDKVTYYHNDTETAWERFPQ